MLFRSKVVKRKRIVFSRYKDKSHPAVVDVNKKCKQMIKKAKIDLEYKLAQNFKDDSKSFFACARSKAKSTVKARILLNNDVVKTDSIAEITEKFIIISHPSSQLRMLTAYQNPKVLIMSLI